MMELENNIEIIYSQFRNLLEIHFPNLIRSTGYGGLSFNAELASENRMFKNTPYFYSGDFKFVHWTSVNNLFSILNNREIRLYNLFNSEDEDEFLYAAEILGIESNQIDHLKKYYYAFSFCRHEDLENSYLWKEYGKDYKGVAIEFSIENDPLEWDGFMISDVQYNVPNSFTEFANGINDLRERYGADFRGLNISKLIGFHKKDCFAQEREVRISTFYPFKNFEEYLKLSKLEFRIGSNRNRTTEYFPLPLWVDNESFAIKSVNPEFSRESKFGSEFFERKPKIKIQNIYFGKNCGLSNTEYYSYRQRIIDQIIFNYGYRLNLPINLFE